MSGKALFWLLIQCYTRGGRPETTGNGWFNPSVIHELVYNTGAVVVVVVVVVVMDTVLFVTPVECPATLAIGPFLATTRTTLSFCMIVEAAKVPGQITVHATALGLKPSSLTFTTV